MNKNITRSILFLLVLSIILPSSLLLCSCKNSNEGFVFGTFYETEVSGFKSKSITKQINNTINEINHILSYDNPNSDFNKINNAKAEEKINISVHTYRLLEIGTKYNKTLYHFNPSLYPLVELWGFTPNMYPIPEETFSIPSTLNIDSLLPYCSMEHFVLSEKNYLVHKKFTETKIDFGAYAKGYVVDILFDFAKSKKAKDIIINIGGTIKTSKPTDIYVENPRKGKTPDKYAAEFFLNQNEAVATSGDYQRYYNLDGVRYSHIIDKNGHASITTNKTPISVTIVGSDAVLCDILSTYIFLTGLTKESKAVLDSLDYSALVITETGHKTYGTKNFKIINNSFKSIIND